MSPLDNGDCFRLVAGLLFSQVQARRNGLDRARPDVVFRFRPERKTAFPPRLPRGVGLLPGISLLASIYSCSSRGHFCLACLERLLRVLSCGLGMAVLEGIPSQTLPASIQVPRRSGIISLSYLVSRLAWSLACGTLWVSLEMLRGQFLSGFPWNFLGVSQFQMLPVIQIASLTGVYGISFLLVWISVSLGNAAFILISEPEKRLKWRGELILPLLALIAVLMFGFRSLLQYRKPARELKIALVQPSIPQSLIWNPQENANRFKQLLQLSELALTTRPELLVWPEAALPSLLRYDQETYEAITNLVRSHGVWLILGSDDAEPRSQASKPNDVDYFNSSFLIDPEGQIIAKYRKQRLVIFGE